MPQGTIKKLVTDRGFGFIKGDQGEIFFHSSEVKGVTFENFTKARKSNTKSARARRGLALLPSKWSE